MRWRRKRELKGPDDSAVRTLITTNVALGAALPPSETDRLVDLTSYLIADKRWEPIGDLALTDVILVTVAANAAIPILNLGPEAYRNVRSILLHGTTRTSTGLRAGPSTGVVTDAPIRTVGQASPNAGPISITWPVALAESRSPAGGRNVVIHEFAHKIDMLDGYSDGTPPLPASALDTWGQLLEAHYGDLAEVPADDPLRSYAFTNPAEFFAVSTEAFFCVPRRLHGARPSLYDALADFYRLDPARRDSGSQA